MRRLIFDYLGRYRWIFLAAIVCHLFSLIGSWYTEGTTVLFFFLGPSAFLLAYEISRHGGGISRTLLSLPCTAAQLARSWRFVALEFPALLFSAVLVISAVVPPFFGGAPHLGVERFLIVAVFQILLLGLSFFALTGVPLKNQGHRTATRIIHDSFFGLIWGLSIPGAMFLMNTLPTRFSALHPAHLVALALMTAATIAGWFRADILLASRFQRTSTTPPKHAKQNVDPQSFRETVRKQIARFGGLPFLMQRFGTNAGLLGLAILSLNWMGMRFFFGLSHPGSGNPHFNHDSVLDGQLQFAIPFVALITGLLSISQLRSLRSMPISRAMITNLLLFWPIAFSFLFCLLGSVLYRIMFGSFMEWNSLKFSLIGAIAAMACVPVVLRFGFRMQILIIFFTGAPLLTVLHGFVKNPDSPFTLGPALTILLPLTFLTVTWYLTYHFLATSHPWRAGQLRLPGQTRRT